MISHVGSFISCSKHILLHKGVLSGSCCILLQLDAWGCITYLVEQVRGEDLECTCMTLQHSIYVVGYIVYTFCNIEGWSIYLKGDTPSHVGRIHAKHCC